MNNHHHTKQNESTYLNRPRTVAVVGRRATHQQIAIRYVFEQLSNRQFCRDIDSNIQTTEGQERNLNDDDLVFGEAEHRCEPRQHRRFARARRRNDAHATSFERNGVSQSFGRSIEKTNHNTRPKKTKTNDDTMCFEITLRCAADEIGDERRERLGVNRQCSHRRRRPQRFNVVVVDDVDVVVGASSSRDAAAAQRALRQRIRRHVSEREQQRRVVRSATTRNDSIAKRRCGGGGLTNNERRRCVACCAAARVVADHIAHCTPNERAVRQREHVERKHTSKQMLE